MFYMKSTADHIFYCTPLRKRLLCTAVLLSSILASLAGPALAADAPSAPGATAADANLAPTDFEYLVSNRKDPFVPFITEKATTSDINMNEIVDVETELTGMQLFEPGQLSLVALMKSGSEDYAMVQDFTGKGYVITKGTKVGRRGVVTEISPNKVVIEETAQTRAGQKIVTNTVMVLKKEGEE